MVFSDTSAKTGLIQACERFTNLGDAGISGNSQKLYEFTTWINDGAKKIYTEIFDCYSGWSYDDSNQTDLPQATTTLTDGTGKYALPSTALSVKRVSVKDENGDWYDLKPFTLDELNTNLDEFMETEGLPMYYRLIGQTIELKPTPSYTQAASLKVYFDRAEVDFTYNDTTDTPGFASIFHEMLAVWASIQWLKIKDPQSGTLALLMRDWEKFIPSDVRAVGTLRRFYTKNFPAKKLKVSRAYETYK